MANATEIKVPVRLEVLQESIAQVKATLSNLKPESTGWKELQNILRSMEKEANNLQVAFSKPFGSQAQFNAAERSIGKIDDALEKARITMSRIKFSDLKLNPDQQQVFNGLKAELKDVENEVKSFKANLKQELQMSEIWDSLKGLDPNATTHSFDQIVSAVQKATTKIEQEVKKAQAAMDSFQPKMANVKQTEEFFKNDNPLRQGLGDTFSNFFQDTKGGLRFKSGGKDAFYQWVEENLTLTDAQISQLKQTATSKLEQAFKDLDITKTINSIKTQGAEKQTNLDNAKARQTQATQVSEALSKSMDSLAAKEDSVSARTEAINSRLRDFKSAAENAARGNESFGTSANKVSSQLQQLRTTLGEVNEQYLRAQQVSMTFNSMKMAVANFMGFNQVLNLTKRAVKDAMNHIKELDSVMNKISIVTDMSTGDLWNQVDAYSKMAQTYGVSIKGAYEVSQIYYQQGLKTNEVLTLTNETLKLSKISGLDYATTTDYMTTALRGFKMEAEEASRVVDVYSALAAHTAVSSEELAVAMSKTASSMESVGSTFEETSAMIGTMVAVTRESATNIGSALKSIAARYGEMKKDPTTLVDADGEMLAFNKVDAALQSVGISMKTTDGQFREFTDVIVELSEKWDTLESTQQRYIATQFAGNRQQSRFLALVSNADLLKQNISVAENSEDTGTLQAIKALDSIESKMEQVKVAYQQFYTTVGAETVWKGALDGIKNYIDYLNGLPKLFGKIPVGAIALISNVIGLIKMAAREAIVWIARTWKDVLGSEAGDTKSLLGQSLIDSIREKRAEAKAEGEALGKTMAEGAAQGAAEASLTTSKIVQNAAKKGTETGAGMGQVTGPVTSSAVTAEVNAAAQLQSSLDTTGFTENIKTSLETLDLSAGTANVQAQFSAMIAGLLSKSAESRAAFSSAGTESIAAYVQGLLTDKSMAVEEARQIAEAVAAQLSTPLADGRTILDAATLDTSIADLGLKDQIQEQLNGFTIDTNTPAQQLQNMFIQIFNTVKDSGGQLKALFESASDDAIAGYIQGLINGTGSVSAAATQVGNVSVDALRSSIGAHSPAVETMLAGQDYMDGLVQGISQHLGEALAKGHEAGKSAVEGLERGLQLNANTFATLKAALLKEFDSLKDELFNSSAERAGIRATLDATTFEGFQGGMADPAFYKFAMMRQDTAEKLIDFGRGKAVAMKRYGSNPKGKAYLDTINSPADYEAQNGQYFSLSIGRQKIIDTMRHEIPSANAKQNIISDYMIDGIPFPESRMGRRAALYQPYYDNAAKNRNGHLADNKLYDAAERQARVDQYHTADTNFQAALQAAAAQRQAEIDSYKSAAQDFENAISGQAPTVEVHADTEPLKTETAEAKAEVEATPVEKPVEATTDAGASVDEQIAKWERLKEIQAEIKAGTGDTAALKSERKGLVNDLGTSYNVGDKTIDAKIAELKGENTQVEVPVVATADTASGTAAKEEVKESVGTTPIETPVEAVPQDSGQLKFDLDNLGAENTITVPLETTPPPTEEVQEQLTQVTGQISMDIPAPDTSAMEQKMTSAAETAEAAAQRVKDAWANYQGSEDAEIMDAMMNGDSLYGMYEGQSFNDGSEPAPQPEPVDTSASQEALDAAKNKSDELNASLQQTGATGEKTGEQLKSGADTAGTGYDNLKPKIEGAGKAAETTGNKGTKSMSQWGRAIGMGLSTIAGLIDKTSEAGGAAAAAITIIGGAITAVMSTGPMAIITGITTALTGIISLVQNFSLEKRLERATKKAEELDTKAKEAKAELNTISKDKEELDELTKKRYDSAEAAEAYQEKVNDLTTKFPGLIKGFDEAGEAIIDASEMEEQLTAAREKSANATYDATKAELEKLRLEQEKKLKDAGTAGSQLEHYNNETHEEEAVDTSAYENSQKARIMESLPSFGEQTWSAMSVAGTTLNAEVWNSENPVHEMDVWMYALSQQHPSMMGGTDRAKNDRIAKVLQGPLASRFSQDREGAHVDWTGIVADLEELQVAYEAGEDIEGYWSDEAEELLKLARAVTGADADLKQAEEAGGSSTGLWENWENIKNEQLKERLANRYDAGEAYDDITLLNEAVSEFNEALDSGDTDRINQAYAYMKDVIREVKRAPGTDYLFDYLEMIDGALGETGTALAELNSTNDAIKATSKKLVSSWMTTQYNTEEFITEGSGLMSILSDATLKKYNSSGTSKKLEDWLSSADAITYTSNLVDEVEQFWTGLSDKNKELFPKMLKDTGNYSFDDFVTTFGISEDNPLYTILKDYYADSEKKIADRLTKKLAEEDLAAILDKDTDTKALFETAKSKVKTTSEEAYFNEVLERYQDLSEKGYGELAKTYAASALSLFDEIDELPAQARANMLALVKKNGLKTREGITAIIESVKTDETLTEQQKADIIADLEATKSTILSNIGLELQTAIDTYLESWKSNSKTISSLSSGVDISDVNAIVTSAAGQAAGIKFDDFVTDGDKLILSAQQTDQYIEKYFEVERGKLNEYRDKIKGIRDHWVEILGEGSQFAEGATIDEAELANIEEVIGEGNLKDYAEWNGTAWIVTDAKGLNDAITTGLDAIDENLTYYDNYITWSEAQVKKTIAWNKGDYSSIKKIYEDKFGEGYDYAKRMRELAAGAKYEDWELALPDISNAVEVMSKGYGSLLTDLLNNGVNHINVNSYKGINATAAQGIIDKYISGEIDMNTMIIHFAQMAGKTIDETNELIAQAITKQTEQTSVDVVKDLNFVDRDTFTTDLKGLKELANKFDIPLQTLLKYYDSSIDQATISVQALKADGIDLTKVTNFKDSVQESIDSMFSDLTSAIESALGGKLSIKNMDVLKQFGERYGVQIDFTRTKDGYRATTESVIELYEVLKDVDAITAQIVLDSLNESIQETNGSLGTTQSLLLRNKEIAGELTYQRGLKTYQDASREKRNVDIFNQQNGNVDLYNRPKIDNGDGSYSTILTTTLESRNFESDIPWVMNITPIPPDAQTVEDILSDEQLNEYIQSLLDQNPIDGTALLELDKVENGGKGLIINLKEATEITDDLVESMGDEAQTLHEISEVYEAIQDGEKYDDTKISQYERELELNREIMELRATSEDSSFKFMDNDIPAGQQNPLNYWENWGKAMSAIKTAGENANQIDYTDFYNIITEMGNLASETNPIKVSGEHILTNCQDAADLIEQAAGALTVASDGSIKVDLSKIGIDFSTGAGEMTDGVDAGIKALAESQIEMLDSMIQLMETIVAMEQLGDIDIEGNGIDFSDLFKATWNPDTQQWERDFTQFSEGYEQYRDYVLERIDKENYPEKFNEDLANGVNNTKLKVGDQEFIFGDMLKMNPSELAQHAEDGLGDAYAAVLQAYKLAAMSGNYDTDNIMSSIKEILAGTGFEGEIEIGDMHLVYKYDTVLEKGKDGKYHVGNKEFPGDEAGLRAAASYQHATELDALQGVASEQAEDGSVTFKHKIVSNVDYDVDSGVYNITFSDGSTATANSKEGANLAIATFAKMTDQELEGAGTQENEAEPITFTIHQKGKANLEFTVENGEVTVVPEGTGDASNASKAKASAQEIVDAEAAKAAQAAEGQKGTATIDNLGIELTADAKITVDLEGKTIEATGTPTATVSTIKIMKDGSFTVTGDEEIWKELVNTKEGEEFTVSVLKLATKQQDGFTNDNGEPIWATIVNSKEGLTFTASVLSLITSKDANFTNDNGTTIWAELATTKEGQEFIAYVSSLKTSPAVSGFTNDKGQTIWDLVDTESDPMTFTAQVLQLLTTQGESFTNDEGASIWSLVSESKEYAAFGAAVLSLVTNQGEGFTNDEGATIWSQVVTDKSYPEFAAMVAKLVTKQGEGYKNDEGESIWSVVKTSKEFDAFTASVKKIAAEWAEGASRELDESQLGIPSEYISPTPITVKKQVNVEYEENTDSDEQFKAQFGREMADIRNDPSQRGYSRTSSVTGITHDVVGSHHTYGQLVPSKDYGGVVIDEANLQRTERYVSLLQEDVSKGGILSETNRANLKELYTVLGDTSSNEQLNTLKETISEILAADATNLEGVSDTITALAEMPVDNVTALADALNLAYSSLVNLSNFDYEGLAARMALLVMPTTQTPSEGESSGDTEQGQTTVVTMVYEADTEPAKEAAEAAKKEIESDPATETIEGEDKATAVGQKAQSTINAMSASITITASNSASSVINSIKSALDNLVNGGPYKVTVEATVKKTGGDDGSEATGNVGLARAAGTLMGELGPELVVSNGRYFVAGQNGAEFVDLADDAIVFNHLQTEQLLKNGMSPGRGQALTNERNAVAFATGNMNGGPAMASASAALAALKQLRSMWQSLLNSSVKDLAGAGGSGGGGGGSDSSAFIKDLEKWYNWLQKIAQLEQEITMEETKRNKIASDMVAHGQDYFKSQLVSLEKLKEEAQTHADLAASQQDYFNKRKDFLNNQSPFSSLYGFDEQGQLKYKDGKLEEFSKMVGTDKYGEANMSAEDQYKYITQTLGIDAKYLKYDSSGNEIESDDYASMVQAFWDKIDADKEEMQSLHDSINEHEQAALEAEQQRNEILKAIEDNQISVENKVLKAMEDSRQREIDELQDQRDAIEQASKDLIDGLSTQLEKEREMYQNQQDQNELFKLQRQLAILQRSGGSASEIASLQEQIAAKQQDAYFTAQQAQIDALQDASDAELERLDHQIDLMQETLDYEKENGLLWSKVYEVMQGSPESIAEYIHRNDSTYWAQSPIKNQQDYRTTLFEAQQYTEFRDTVKNGLASLITNTTPSTAGSSSDGSSSGDNGGSSGSSGSGSDSGSGSGGSGGSGGGGGKWEDTGNVSGWKKNNTYHWKEKEQKNSKTGKTKWVEDKTTKGKHDKNKSDYRPGTSYQYCSVCGRLMETINTNTGKRTSYDIGGIVEHDGEAVLHAKEAVLTAHQTSILRNEILGNSPKSLMNLLLDFRDSYSGLGSNVSTSNSSEAFVIEHAEVNMNVEKIANDYDAQRAGEQALNKMLSIARKTQAQNRIGR